MMHQSNGYYLYRNAWRFAGAPHQEQQLKPTDYQQLLKKGGLLVRNTYGFDQQEESGFWYVVKDRFAGFDELSSKCRNMIRRANKTYSYKIIDNEELQKRGFEIYKENLLSYDPKNKKITKEDFLQFFMDGITECWGCFLAGSDTLVGFAINYVWPDACDYEILSVLPKYKHNTTYPYYGLIHAMNEHYLHKRQMRYVTDGTRSITEHSKIQPFLEKRFNFRKAYCRLEIHYNWWMTVAVKILYPFRKIVPIPSVKAVLNMESMVR